MYSRIAAFTTLLVFNLCCMTGYISPIGIRWNTSESLSKRLFVSSRNLGEIGRGDYVVLDLPGYDEHLAKQVIGVSGDYIEVREGTVFVGGKNAGTVSPYSPSGMEMHPIHEGVIPEGSYFVSGEHSQSFDSRYAEFGLVSEEQIRERVWPII